MGRPAASTPCTRRTVNFLIRFLDDHLLPQIPDDGRLEAEESMVSLSYGLTAIQAFARKRREQARAGTIC